MLVTWQTNYDNRSFVFLFDLKFVPFRTVVI